MIDNENEWQNQEPTSEDVQDDNYYDESIEGKKNNSLIITIVIIFLLLIGIGAFIMFSHSGDNQGQQLAATNQNNETTQENDFMPDINNNNPDGNPQGETTNNSENNDGDYFFEAAGGNSSDLVNINFNNDGSAEVTNNEIGAEPITVTNSTSQPTLPPTLVVNDKELENEVKNKINSSDLLMVSLGRTIRKNPFLPIISAKAPIRENLNSTGFEIIEPPTQYFADPNLTALMQTTISGIMYDSVSPSAIVKLNGVDQFVKVGDNISGYKISAITKDKVVIQYGSNVYAASVGQLFAKSSIASSGVANLSNKFGGVK